MEQVFTSEFWHKQLDVVMSAPSLIIPLILLSFGIGGWLMRIVDGGEIRGVKAENNALKELRNLATTEQGVVTKGIAEVRLEIEQLKMKVKSAEARIPEIEKLSTATAAIANRLDIISQANTTLGKTLSLSARSSGRGGSTSSIASKGPGIA